MNLTGQPFAVGGRRDDAPKKFHLSLKKTRIQEQKQESYKENNFKAADDRSDIYDYRKIDLCTSDSSSPDSQNYNLRLSDSPRETTNKKKMPCYYGSNNSKWVKDDTDGTVLVGDSTGSGSSNADSPRRYIDKKSRICTPYYRNREKKFEPPVDIIVLESSESDDDRSFETEKRSTGLLSLDSDDDSLLRTLKINSRKSVDNAGSKGWPGGSVKSDGRHRIADSSSSFVPKNTNRILTNCDRQAGYENADFTTKLPPLNRRTRSNTSSSGSSSRNFSPGADIVLGSDLSHEFKITSESSRSNKALIKCSGGQRTKGKSPNSKSTFRNDNMVKSDDNRRENVSVERNFANITCRSTSKSRIMMKSYDSVKLTKKDAQRIIKGIKIPGNPHWTPKLDSPYFEYEKESLSQGEKKDDKINGDLINETKSELLISESSSDDEIIAKPSENLIPSKTHVSRFMNTPNQEQRSIDGLSEKKKTEISNWLMNNTPGSSSSSSIISESNRNSSFGNSSLERFELKHETPNNRGKISKPGTSEKVNSVPSATERLIYKGKTSVLKNQTPVGACNSAKMKTATNQATTPTPLAKPTEHVAKKSLPIVTAVENLHIEDCADILDKLYGNVWRNKADAVFTAKTEPKPRKNITNRGQSKTERKQKPKYIKGERKILSSSEEDEFDAFTKNIRPNLNSTKKKLSRTSFIDDKSPSENSSESFYYTALTNPGESKGITQLQKPTPVSALTRRAVAICDSDSDSDGESNPQRSVTPNFERKRLSFSEDSTDTSEFDPGELVLPKSKTKKAPVKKYEQTFKHADNQTVQKHSVNVDKRTRSFLASLSATVPIQNCHPEAKVYRDNYKNKKEELCKYLFKLYNKEIFESKLPDDMPIEWNVRMRGTAGFCYNKKSVKALGGIVRSSRIVLATKILDTPDRLRDTLVHEMCHAAAWLINNVSDGHGPYWKGWASKAMKTFPELPPIKRCHDYKIKTKFTYKCMTCGYSIGRHSKSLNVERKRCGLCFGKFELLINRTTRSGTTQIATPVQARTPTGFALFVKENYHSVKKDRRSIKHGEVMKILGQQFSAVKIAKKSTDIDRT